MVHYHNTTIKRAIELYPQHKETILALYRRVGRISSQKLKEAKRGIYAPGFYEKMKKEGWGFCSLEVRQKITDKLKREKKSAYFNDELRAKSRAKSTQSSNNTIEVKIQEFLKQLGIEFYTHQYMKLDNAYQCDIFIPLQRGINYKTIIECDGDYWHGNLNSKRHNYNSWKDLTQKQKVQKIKDYLRNAEMESRGYTVIRLWEREIRVMDINKFKDILEGEIGI